MSISHVCPNPKSREMRLLVSKMTNSMTAEQDAYNIWEANGGEYPEDILAEVNPEVVIEGETPLTNLQIAAKQKIIEDAISVINKKLNRLSSIGAKEEHIAEYEKLLQNLKNLEANAAIIEFIKTSERIIHTGEKTIAELEEKIVNNTDKNFSLKGLSQIKTYIGALDLLAEIRNDLFKEKEFKDSIPLLNDLIIRQKAITQKTIDLYKEAMIPVISANNKSLEKYYEYQAEREFNGSQKAKTLKGKELSTARKEYIENYILDNKGKIEAAKRDDARNMLTYIEDIDQMISLFVAPADINNPVIAYAYNLYDRADFNKNVRMNKQADIFNDLHKRYTKFIGKKSNMEEFYAPLLEKDAEGKLTGYLVNPNSKEQFKAIKEGKYKGTVVEELYDELVSLQIEKDKVLPNGMKLGFRIPNINKSLLERVYSENIISSTKESLFDAFRVTKADTEFGTDEERVSKETEDNIEARRIGKKIEVITNELGEKRQGIPIHYRGKFDPKSQSYDLLGVLMLDLNNVTNYKEKSIIAPEIDLLMTTVAEADVIQRDWKGNLEIDKTKDGSGKAAVKKGIYSNVYKNLDELRKMREFGISVEGNPNIIKTINVAKNVTSTINQALNPFSAGANLMQGTSMEWLETFGGETRSYTKANLIQAYGKYSKELPNIVKDLMENAPQSKTNLLAREYQLHQVFSNMDRKFIEDSIAKKLGPDVLRSLDSMTEKHLQVILMYAMMDNIKVLDKNGNFLDKDFKPTKDRSKAIGLDEAYEVKDGVLYLDSRAIKSERTDNLDEDRLKLKKYFGSVSRKMFGNYTPENKSRAQRTIVGHLVFQMRGWLIPGFERRYKGISKAFIKAEDLSQAQRDYNTETEQYEEGIYTTGIRFIATVAKELKASKIQAIPENWNKLTDYEKGNMLKMVYEAAVIASSLALAMAFKAGLEDDEDNIPLQLAAYYSRRLFSETFTYANPKEGLRTLKSPAVIMGTIEDVINLIEQSFDPTEEYETGDRKGELKIRYAVEKLIPIERQRIKDLDRMRLFLEK